METAKVIFKEVFWFCGLPEEDMSDFTSHTFSNHLNINIDLSYNVHLLTNQTEWLNQEIRRVLSVPTTSMNGATVF